MARKQEKGAAGQYSADSIKVLGGIDHVRLRPAMYIGDTGERGLHHLFEEVVANSIDEAMVGECDEISVRVYGDGSMSVTDNGRGIPVDIHKETGKPALEVVMCTLNAGGKFDHNAYKVSAGLHGVGVSCVNALSEWLEVEVWRDGGLYYQRYERGVPKTPVEKRGKAQRRGTKVTFKADPELFGDIRFHPDVIEQRLRELAFLNSGVKIKLSRESDGHEETFHYQRGIEEFVEFLNQNKELLHKDVIMVKSEGENLVCEIGLQYNDGYNEVCLSFANNMNTVDGGTHLSGFRSALTRTLNNWGRAHGLLKDDAPTGEDYREGLTAVVSVKLPNPQFEGQTKARLGNRELQGQVEQVFGEQLATFCEEHPRIAGAIVGKAVEAASAREAAKKARDLTRRKGALSGAGLPSKLRDCSRREREGTELFIVEGQSAGGTASMGRDREFQAILPLRGVILNVEKARVDKMLRNEEITTLIAALGTGIGAEDFDLEKLRYGKIIIMTDADIDGAHIRTLLLTFFFRQMPAIIEKGHLFIAQPPLYRVVRKGQKQYVYNDRAFQQVLLDLGVADACLEYKVNGEAGPKRLENGEFKKLLKVLASLEGLMRMVEQRGVAFGDYLRLRDPEKGHEFPLYRVVHTDGEGNALERYFYNEEEYDRFVLALQKSLQASGHELEIVEEDDYGSMARAKAAPDTVRPRKFSEAPQIARIVAEIEARGIPITCLLPPVGAQKDALEGGRFTIQSDGATTTVSSLVEVIPAVKEMGRKGLDIERFKGLGEMNATELADTTLRPDSRTVLQVSVGDAIKAERYFSILAGADVKQRREFIETHALEVHNLDV